MNEVIQDRGFLEQLNNYAVKRYKAAIMVLDFETERPIARFEGKVIGGSISVATNTPTRRTGSLRVALDQLNQDVLEVGQMLAIDKKISISIGLENPFYNGLYHKYGDTIWFKQGTFILTASNSSFSATSGPSINIQFVDKMALLNGVCGGTLPATASLHERIEISPDENVTTTYPKIRQIVYETVHHFGGEHPSKIIIEDIPEYGKQVVTWAGSTPVWFAKNSGAYIVSNTPNPNFPNRKILGEDIGYMTTELTYPGELVMKGGSTVTQILDEIVKTLGNFEYFYDVDGFFHFKRINDFNKTGQAPSVGAIEATNTPFNISGNADLDSKFQQQYLPRYYDDQFLNEFMTTKLVESVSLNPQYSNIKNDFVVWGTRKAKKKEEEVTVRYHLAIDKRPKADLLTSLCYKDIWLVRSASTKEVRRYVAIGYKPGAMAPQPSVGEIGNASIGSVDFRGEYATNVKYIFEGNVPLSVKSGTDYFALRDVPETREGLLGKAPAAHPQFWRKIEPSEEEMFLHSPSLLRLGLGDQYFEWREELYRRALMAYGSSDRGSYYDEELMAEWRAIYNPNDKSYDPFSAVAGFKNPYWSTFKTEWDGHFANTVKWNGYNVDIIRSPQKIRFWLDLIDVNSPLGKYSVDRIGRRSVVKDNNKINEVLNREVPVISFIDGSKPAAEVQDAEKDCIVMGQTYCIVKPEHIPYFAIRNSFGTCFEEIRELLMTHLLYNTSISLNCVPLLYLDVNKIVQVNFPPCGISGNYIINSLSFNFDNMSTMSAQLNEAIVIV